VREWWAIEDRPPAGGGMRIAKRDKPNIK